MKMDTNKHSVFLLFYHLVLVTKCRKRVLNDELSNYAKEMFKRIGEPYHITVVKWDYEEDHVQVVFKTQPKQN